MKSFCEKEFYEMDWKDNAAKRFDETLARWRSKKPRVFMHTTWRYYFSEFCCGGGITVQHSPLWLLPKHPILWIKNFRIRGVFKTLFRYLRKKFARS